MTRRPMFGAIPTVAIVINLVDLLGFGVPHAVKRGHASVWPDRIARIDLLDLRRVWKNLELDDSFGHGRSVESAGRTWRQARPRACAPQARAPPRGTNARPRIICR